jgi:acetyl/propionyl-CoA carboxylase alpha subunit
VRVYAEDPLNNFLPDTGNLITYKRPQGPGIRVDDGFEEGMEIPVYYDPMIAKLVVHADTRQEAILRMLRAIREYDITGVATTLDFCRFVLQHPAFASGKFDTKFVEQHFQPEQLKQPLSAVEREVAAALAAYIHENHRANQYNYASNSKSQWHKRRG